MSTAEMPAPPPAGTPPTTPRKGLAVAALCVGIAAFLTGLVPVLGVVLGLGAVVLGVLSLRAVKAGTGSSKGMGITGLVLGGIATLTGVVVLILAVVLAASGDVDTTASAPSPSEAATPEDTASSSPATPPAPEASEPAETPDAAPSPTADELPGVGVPVTTKDGAQYTLTAFTCGIPQVGTEPFNSKAQGEYCQADLTLNNTGKKSVSFNASDVKAFAGDVEYEVDSSASLYAEEGNAFLEDVNPGNTLQSKVFFDIPSGTRLERMEVGGGLFSEGEMIALP